MTELERLRLENHQLREEIAALRARLAESEAGAAAYLDIIKGLVKGGPPVDVDENTCWACDISGPEDGSVDELPDDCHKATCVWRQGREVLSAAAIRRAAGETK